VTERYTRLKTLTQEIKQRMDAKDFAAVIALSKMFRRLYLLESLQPGAAKILREVPFRPGLNIVCAGPYTRRAKAGGVRVSGHSAGKRVAAGRM
jgi:hypothetical protein